ncbi:MAG: glutamate synthase subunit beta [Deltaproteobacteria bacterium]|nr:MAG: glutamate synthase subunit beta [Deltaproteobacteria bacterium]
MGDPRGFMMVRRQESGYRPVEERVTDYIEVEKQLPEEQRKLQASRCMDCGVAFCHWGCPVSNIMPEWQELIFRGRWKEAYEYLQETNNFPEFTGRVCPAPCEASCVLSINDEPVTIRQNELAVIEKAFEEGYVQPRIPSDRTGKKVAVIGSGPAGLACADILNQKGHAVTIFEAEDSVGGYLRFGIPDFKLEKRVIDRRVNLMVEEGVVVRTGVRAGKDVSTDDLRKDFDAICVTIGARAPRDLNNEGRDLDGIYHAMVYLAQQNRIVRGDKIADSCIINAYNKNVVVIGGGDTGSDCVGSANRQGAVSITQLEIMPMPPKQRTENEPWPLWPKILKTSSSHEEGCERMWNVTTKRFIGEAGKVKKLLCAKVQWEADDKGTLIPREVPGSEFDLDADIVLLAMGFVHVEQEGLVKDLGVNLNHAGNVAVDEGYMTSVDGVFAAGDTVRGASLVVWAIHQGREAAVSIDRYLASR